MESKHLEKRYLQEDKLSFEEFEEKFLEYIPAENLSNRFIDNNTDFIDSIILQMWIHYTNFYNVDVIVFLKLSESFFVNLFRYQPVLDNTEYKD